MKYATIAKLTLLALVSVGCDDPPTSPSSPPDPLPEPPVVSTVGRIAFVSTRDGGYDIYLIRADGTGLTRLVRGESPAWSPNGRTLAFHAFNGVAGEVRLIEADGSNERVVSGDGARQPAWSPDGRKIVFARFPGIFVVDADGTGERLLVGLDSLRAWTDYGSSSDPFAWLSDPAWSPDGEYIAMVVQAGWGAERILIARADGSARRAGSPLLEGSTVDWSPDGSRLVLSRHGAGPSPPNDLVVSVGVDGSGEYVHAFRGGEPAWSSDGTNLVYSNPPVWSCWDPCPGRIWVADPTNDRRKQLVPDAVAATQSVYSDSQPAWSPRIE